jgi:hypothetical protein
MLLNEANVVAGGEDESLTWHGKRDVRVDNVPDPTIQEPRIFSRFLADSQSALIRRW